MQSPPSKAGPAWTWLGGRSAARATDSGARGLAQGGRRPRSLARKPRGVRSRGWPPDLTVGVRGIEGRSEGVGAHRIRDSRVPPGSKLSQLK
jgi:hypothetical protein